MGYRRPRAMARLHALAETGGGLLLALGLLVPLAAAAVFGTMVNAIVVAHAPHGLWSQDGGYEYPLALATTVGGLTLVGPGAWALDSVIGWGLAAPSWGLAGIVLGLVVGVAVLGLGRRPAGQPTRSGDTSGTAPAA